MLFGRHDWILLLSIPWALVVLYFGFPVGGLGYFQKFPVQWDELDEEQKWYYGTAAQSGQLTKRVIFDIHMMSEWIQLAKKFKAKYGLK
jgi:hypothetical protein